MLNRILSYFDAVNAIPRCSKHEAQLCHWLTQWGIDRRYATRTDAVGNLVIQVPASPSYENAPTVIIQGHMDMVCEKTASSIHDFSQDPIVARRDGDWLMAKDTSLGADNGIALAYALTVADHAAPDHPPLELLFTVDEESGLTGVKQLGAGLISGRYLINLDSEEEGVFTIGCAGGKQTSLSMELNADRIPETWHGLELVIGGLRGGHSGVDIHKDRGNANKLMARTLARIRQIAPIRLVQFMGGSRHNALAREATAFIAGPPEQIKVFAQEVAAMQQTIKREFADNDPDLYLTLQPRSLQPDVGLTLEETDRILWLLLALPHGAVRMSPVHEGIVETSCNLAVVQISRQRLRVISSQRSLSNSRLEEMTASVHAIADLSGAAAIDENDYPPWPPDPQTALIQSATAVYRKLFAQPPKIQVMHAGLECAIIGARYPGLEMISFGPTIENPHSPMERLHIPSVEKVWRLLTAMLSNFKIEN